MKKVILSPNAPAAIGPYVHAAIHDNTVYVSGQLGIDVKTGEFPKGVEAQTTCSLNHLKAILESANSSLDNVLKTTIFLADMNDFAVVNKIYGNFFKEPYPARSTIQVARLPKDALVEIECIAALN